MMRQWPLLRSLRTILYSQYTAPGRTTYANNQQKLILRSGPTSDYGTQAAYGPTSRVDAQQNYATHAPQTGYPTQSGGSYPTQGAYPPRCRKVVAAIRHRMCLILPMHHPQEWAINHFQPLPTGAGRSFKRTHNWSVLYPAGPTTHTQCRGIIHPAT